MATGGRLGTTTVIRMSDADLLTLTQWLSPAFPVGSFAYSHGLEFAISAGQVTSADSLEAWLADVLRFGAGRADAVMLTCAMTGAAPVTEIALLAEALAGSRERLAETREQGAAFTRTVNALTGTQRPAAPLPVAVGAAAAGLSLPPERVAGLYLHAFASNLASAAVRFIPLGQTEGQGVVARLHPVIQEVAAQAASAGLDDISTSVLGADMAATAHETQQVRLFKT